MFIQRKDKKNARMVSITLLSHFTFCAFLYNIGDLLKLGPANITGLPIDTLDMVETVELAIGWVRSRFIICGKEFNMQCLARFGCSQIEPQFKVKTRML